MTDLEDSILKENVGGRWSRHTGNQDDNYRIDNTDNDDHHYAKAYDADEDYTIDDEGLLEEMAGLDIKSRTMINDLPETVGQAIIADRNRANVKTGVKGVLADYRMAQQINKATKDEYEAYKAAVFKRMTEGSIRPADPIDILKMQSGRKVDEDGNDREEDDEYDELLDGDDDVFMHQFRQQRLKEMKAATVTKVPTFGEIIDITSDSFNEEVDNVDARVFVIVHVYERGISSCNTMNGYLTSIASTMINTKFIRICASENDIEIDRIILPCLNIYKGGELLVSLNTLEIELGDRFTREDVEWLIDMNIKS